MSEHTVSNPSSDESLATRAGWRAMLARPAAFLRTEYGIVVTALGAVGLHIVDDNFLQPEPGTSAGTT